MSIVILRNIASDAAWILQNRLGDRRRSKPFEALAERADAGLARDLRAALVRQKTSLAAANPAVADEIDELIIRVDGLSR